MRYENFEEGHLAAQAARVGKGFSNNEVKGNCKKFSMNLESCYTFGKVFLRGVYMRKIIKLFIGIIFLVSVMFVGGILFIEKMFLSNEGNLVNHESVESHDVEHFIGGIGETARKLAAENDLYASVLLAQAILESDQGRSGLASAPNFNLFGMKGKYNEASVELKTQEDDGEGNMTTIVAEFRKYPSYEASIEDYVGLLRNGVSWDETFYEGAFKSNTSSYEEVTAFLTGTYATDSSYENKLNYLIEQYDLQKYDLPANQFQEVNAES